MINIRHYSIVLASQSPRRKQMLAQAGIKFRVKTNYSEEIFPEKLSTARIPVYLARQKAQAVLLGIKSNEIILAADTIVVIGGKIIGKPQDYKDAVRILKMLSGRKHRVITGVCLLSAKKAKTFSAITDVFFRRLTDEQIHFYLKRFKPFDKAGAYAIQEWIGLIGIEKINGDYFNVVGLPISRVVEELKKF